MRVCNGLGVGVDVDQELRHGARYQDKRAVAKQMWASVMDILRLIKAIPVAAAWPLATFFRHGKRGRSGISESE
jgi:hypothetical protein